MLSVRAMNNLFKNQSSQHVAGLNRQRLVDAVTPHLVHSDKNVRQAAITLMMNYSAEFQMKEDREGRIQITSALATCVNQERDLQNLLRAAIALGNLAHKNEEVGALIRTIGIQFPEESQVQAAQGEANVDQSKQTIREIKAMLLEE